MAKKVNKDDSTFFSILLGVFAVFAIKSIFEHDNSKIISKKGSDILSDEGRMNEIQEKLNVVDGKNNYSEIII